MQRRFFGILVRKERWGLSLRGWLVLASAIALCGWLVLINIYGFLALTCRVPAKTLVVEGWVHEYVIEAGTKEFQSGGYDKVFTTGGPVVGKGGYVNDYNTSASVGAELLKKAGIPSESLQMVPSHAIGRDRTYSSAVALREWFRDRGAHITSLNIVTEGTHARRTRLLFAKALGPEVSVGVIAVPNTDYDARHWWLYSQGVEDVLEEGVGYLYARFFFHPEPPK